MILFAATLLAGDKAFATADVIGQAAESARKNSQAAAANRNLADRLYKQSLADHDAAWSRFPPSVSLLSKALQESKDAKAADDQAKEFARGAMHAVHTGGTSGDFDLKEYGVLSATQLDNLANGSSPYMPAAEKTLGKYGMKLSADKMSISTPLGSLPLDMSLETLEKGLRGVASSLGYNPDDVSKGLRQGVQTRDGLAAQVMASLNTESGGTASGGASAPGGVASTTGSAAATVTAQAESNTAMIAAANANEDSSDAAAAPGTAGPDHRQEELKRNRAAFLRTMGVGGAQAPKEPLGAAHQDIFAMVHLRYQSKLGGGEFIETEDIPTMAVASVNSTDKKATAPSRAPAAAPVANGPIVPLPQNKISSR